MNWHIGLKQLDSSTSPRVTEQQDRIPPNAVNRLPTLRLIEAVSSIAALCFLESR